MSIENSFIIQEQNLLRLLIENNNLISVLSKDYLITDSAKFLLQAFQDCLRDNLTVDIRNVTSKVNQYLDISEKQIESLFDLPVPQDSFDDIFMTVKKEWAKDHLRNVVFSKLVTEVSSKKSFDIEIFKNLEKDLQDKLRILEDNNNKVYTLPEMMDIYEKELHDRNSGATFYDTGCSYLNKHLLEGFAPQKITSIFGSSGVGKSTYALYLINKMINKQIPCCYFSPEMPLVSTMDRLIAQRNRIPISEFYPHLKEDNNPKIEDYIFDILKKERVRLGSQSKFRFVEQESISLSFIEETVKRFMQEENLSYAVIFIDLLTMVREFNTGNKSKADKYEDAMNTLHEIARRLNIHIVGVVQAKRPQNKVHISGIEDLDKLKPGSEDIKNSAAIEERSRIILGTYRRKFFAEKYLPDDPETEILDSDLEVSILKQNMGKLGTLKYYFDGASSYLCKFEDPDTSDELDLDDI